MEKRPSFLALPRPVVACILGEKTIDENISIIKNGEQDGAPAFVIHMERLANQREIFTPENLTRMIRCTKRPVMCLRYRGGDYAFNEEERVEILLRAIECGAACVDFTADTFDPSPMEFTTNKEAVDRQMRAIEKVHEMGGEVVMSSHIPDRSRTCDEIVEHLKAVEKRGADYAKIVTLADTEEEFLEAIKTTMVLRREMKVPFIFLCGGKFGPALRYIGPKLGNSLTFCVDRYTPNFVSIQPTVNNMTNVLNNFAWRIEDTEE